MPAALAFDLFSGAGTSPAPFVVVEMGGIAPRGKGRPRFRVIQPRYGRAFASVYTDAQTRSYEEALADKARTAMRGRKPLEGPVAVRVVAAMPIPQSWPNKRRDAALAGTVMPTGRLDIDNICKSIFDAFNGIVFVDDGQIVRSLAEKGYSEGPGLIVEVYEIFPSGGQGT